MKQLAGNQLMLRSFIICFLFLGLQACSGGGGSTANTAPTISAVSITDSNNGNVEFGDTLTATYTYNDLDGDAEGTTTFVWLRNDIAISGQTGTTYSVLITDAADTITVEVSPVALNGILNGTTISSTAISVEDFSNKLNDTGITTCGDYAYTDAGTSYDVTGSGTHNNDLDCSIQATVPTQTSDGSEVPGTGGDIIRAGQDVLYGEDATNNDDSDGRAGFSFTKLDANGVALTNQTVAWNAAGSEATFDQWSCVQDNVTGLIWEVKTTSGLRTNTYTYTWYNSTGINDGGEHGIGDTGVGTTTGYETGGAAVGSDNCSDTARCDTEKFVEDVNTVGLCGATDWRLPGVHELLSIVDLSVINPAVDSNYFPNTMSSTHWSSTSASSNVASSGIEGAWYVDFSVVSINSDDDTKNIAKPSRLVRGN
ncbi:MAG: DUF1566 domain-containing protein [Woeseiaceae bacterium]